MRSCFRLSIAAISILLLLCAPQITPRLAAQVSCTVTYNCHGSSQCASLTGGPRTLNFASASECKAQAATVGDGTIASCSCNGGGGTSATDTGIPVSSVPGHEFDGVVSRAIADGLTGKLSPGNAVGFTVLGLFGNALFAPKNTAPVDAPDPAVQQRQLAASQLNNSGIYLLRQKTMLVRSMSFSRLSPTLQTTQTSLTICS